MANVNHSLENSLYVSWSDSAWLNILNPSNAMEYFSGTTNPFYDRNCNNEMVKMQRLNPEQLNNMTGIEYILLHVQQPILYVIRKQHRTSPTQVTALADYYIIAGVVYQAPDLATVINSRMVNTLHNLGSAFHEAQSYVRCHPTKGYWFEFNSKTQTEKVQEDDSKKSKKKKEEPSSMFQRQRVDILLTELGKKFPLKHPAPALPQPDKPAEEAPKEVKAEVKTEKPDDKSSVTSSQPSSIKPPPEKKPKLMR